MLFAFVHINAGAGECNQITKSIYISRIIEMVSIALLSWHTNIQHKAQLSWWFVQKSSNRCQYWNVHTFIERTKINGVKNQRLKSRLLIKWNEINWIWNGGLHHVPRKSDFKLDQQCCLKSEWRWSNFQFQWQVKRSN